MFVEVSGQVIDLGVDDHIARRARIVLGYFFCIVHLDQFFVSVLRSVLMMMLENLGIRVEQCLSVVSILDCTGCRPETEVTGH